MGTPALSSRPTGPRVPASPSGHRHRPQNPRGSAVGWGDLPHDGGRLVSALGTSLPPSAAGRGRPGELLGPWGSLTRVAAPVGGRLRGSSHLAVGGAEARGVLAPSGPAWTSSPRVPVVLCRGGPFVSRGRLCHSAGGTRSRGLLPAPRPPSPRKAPWACPERPGRGRGRCVDLVAERPPSPLPGRPCGGGAGTATAGRNVGDTAGWRRPAENNRAMTIGGR